MAEYLRRGFLNEDAGTAMFQASIDGDQSWVTAEFKVSDCFRTSNLDFSYGTMTSKRERTRKLDLLIRELEMFRQELECRNVKSR